MTTPEIASLLEQIAANPELTRMLTNIVAAQLDGQSDAGIEVAPAVKDEDLLNAIRRIQENFLHSLDLPCPDGDIMNTCSVTQLAEGLIKAGRTPACEFDINEVCQVPNPISLFPG